MTQGYQPPARGSGTSADQDTTTLPKLPPSQAPGQPSGGWSPSSTVNTGSSATDDGTGGFGSRLSSAASAAAATASSAAGSATSAMRAAAGEAESRSGRARGAGRSSRQPRRARLTLSHVNVYSVFKFACVLAIALFFVWLIMVGVLYGVLDFAGVFNKINDTVHTISGDGKTTDVVTASLVFGGAIIIGAVNIVLFIALSTIGAMIYNLCADLVGGAEVTLSERE